MKLLHMYVGDPSRHLTPESQAGARGGPEVNAFDVDICGRLAIANSIFIPATLKNYCIITYANVAVLYANIL
jgi:hypothetical protein